MHYRSFALAAMLCASPLHAQGALEDLDLLDRRIAAVAGAPVGADGGPMTPLDRRLRLPACPEPALIEPSASGLIAVRCAQLGWRASVRPKAAVAPPGNPGSTAVRRGDQIALRYEAMGFSAISSATALETAVVGSPVRVKTAANVTVVATVSAVGEARISD